MTTPTDTLRKLAEAGGLIERLRAVESSSEKAGRDCTNWYRNPDGPEAADALTALLDEGRQMREALQTIADGYAGCDDFQDAQAIASQALQATGNPLEGGK